MSNATLSSALASGGLSQLLLLLLGLGAQFKRQGQLSGFKQ